MWGIVAGGRWPGDGIFPATVHTFLGGYFGVREASEKASWSGVPPHRPVSWGHDRAICAAGAAADGGAWCAPPGFGPSAGRAAGVAYLFARRPPASARTGRAPAESASGSAVPPHPWATPPDAPPPTRLPPLDASSHAPDGGHPAHHLTHPDGGHLTR
ncbi:hypothetical protein Sliba_20310 [Streptomyces nigrescens]|uniref:Uncharacterized protein n=1 Tax=Streptomyces nigrescens TaxID=1920 RepID=A0A640TDX7_STRNI|nr:hypothetical protein Sliba_20310 [Streptomyces libani subsp. libani]GGW06687.1 hypothetical protein GCM10010500_73760 [Streptomyces libani subsp. libani]